MGIHWTATVPTYFRELNPSFCDHDAIAPPRHVLLYKCKIKNASTIVKTGPYS